VLAQVHGDDLFYVLWSIFDIAFASDVGQAGGCGSRADRESLRCRFGPMLAGKVANLSPLLIRNGFVSLDEVP